MSGTVETNVFSLNKLYQLVVDGRVTYDAPDGYIYAWGSNVNGELGQNNTTDSPTPIPVFGLWSQAEAGPGFSVARKTDNTLWTWGGNYNGQLGQNDRVNRSSPVQVPGTAWTDISATSSRAFGAYSSIFARKSDGTLWTWGLNLRGRLGLNDTICRSSPVQVPGTSWVEISSGALATLARKSDNTLWAWGSNYNGELGQSNLILRSSPVQIPGTEWTQVSMATYMGFARKSDGTLWSWGDASITGLGDCISRSSPIQVPGNVWRSVSASSDSVLAI